MGEDHDRKPPLFSLHKSSVGLFPKKKPSVDVQLKLVLDLLREVFLEPLLWSKYMKFCKVDENSSTVVLDRLKNYCKVHYDGRLFQYKFLKAEESIFGCSRMATHMEMLSTLMTVGSPIKVEDDLKRLFREISLPADRIDIQKYLHQNSMKPATHTDNRQVMTKVHGVPSSPSLKRSSAMARG
ncbi:unnamed protein product [Ilex paraguariensis]|uniref:Uncharacterized protein n=1 Tax=Ilex paraguariensis TaxID=185542 RepID=A0ABC8SUZ9_9AQUA